MMFVFRYPIDDDFLLNVRDEIVYQVERLQNHPSIVLWAGNNENELIISAFFHRKFSNENMRKNC